MVRLAAERLLNRNSSAARARETLESQLCPRMSGNGEHGGRICMQEYRIAVQLEG